MANGKRNTLRFRLDIYNFSNWLNSDWGVASVSTATQPLTFASVNAAGLPVFRLNTQVLNGETILLKDSFIKGNSLGDVYQIQLGLRYIFN